MALIYYGRGMETRDTVAEMLRHIGVESGTYTESVRAQIEEIMGTKQEGDG